MRRFVLTVTLAALCASCAVEREGSTQGEGTGRWSDAGDGDSPPPDATCGTDDAGGPQPDAGSDPYPDAGGGYPDAGDPYPDAGGHPYPDAGAW